MATSTRKTMSRILSENLKRVRESKGISRKQLADATGIAANMIAEYETARSLPPIDKIFALAEALETSIVSVTGDTGYSLDYPSTADIAGQIFEYRLKRALDMAERGHGRVERGGDGRVILTLPKKIEQDTDGTLFFNGSTSYAFKGAATFVEVMEAAERTALSHDVTFSEVLRDLREAYAEKLD